MNGGLRRSMALVTAVLVAGCDGSRLGGPLATAGGTGTTGAASGSDLVGTWRRVLYFIAEDGSSGSNETTWRFNANRTATRITVTRNFTAGVYDAQTLDATWEPLTQSVRLTYLPPSAGTFEFAYRVSADTLYLASQAYGRVGP